MSRKRAKESPDDLDLAKQVREWRRARRLSQEQLEGKAGLSHNAISRIENGQVSPRLDTLDAIADALEISVEQLQFRRPPTSSTEPRPVEDDMTELASLLSSVPAAKRAKALETFRKIIELMEDEQ
jgi:transcriptional regulator with XRE-family HTH domain